MNRAEVKRWFDGYLAAFVAIGRGDADVRRVLDYYAVPLVLSIDQGTQHLTDEEQLLAAMGAQIDNMRAAGFDRSDELAAETTVLNGTCAIHRGRLARYRADGTEINRFDSTYLITDGAAGRRISALVIH
jgi:hypothetical protein